MSVKSVFVCTALAVLLLPAVNYAERIDFLTSQELRSTLSVSETRNGTAGAGEKVGDRIDPTPSGFANTFYAYSVDLLNIVRTPRATRLFDEVADNNASNTITANLQGRIWETLYDSPTDGATTVYTSLIDGGFRLNSTEDPRTYEARLGSLVDGSSTGSAARLDTSLSQDRLTQRVSEPSTLLLLGTAMLLMAGRLRRPKSKPNPPTTS